MASLALGVAGLGLGLEKALPLHSFGQAIGALIAFVMLLFIAAKYALNPALLRRDIKDPVTGSVLPTFAMALMLISKTLSTWNATAGTNLWLIAIALHLTLAVVFAFHRLKSFSLQQMVPSWFVPFVGIIMPAVTIPDLHYAGLAYALMIAGMVNYAVLLPAMLYRLIFSPEIADAAKPTIAVLAAPASLALAGYLTIEPNPSLLLGSVLLGIALLMTGIIYLAFFKLLRLNFTPAFAAYTFPMAIGATALYKAAEHLAGYPFAAEYARQLGAIAVVEMVITSLIVCYVCLRYSMHYLGKYTSLRAPGLRACP